MKKPFIIHPFLFAIFPILFLFSHNVDQVSYSELLLPSAIVLGFTLLLILLSRSIFKDNNKSGIIISLFIILFFSYGHIHDLMWTHLTSTLGRNVQVVGEKKYLSIAWGLLFIYGAYLTRRTRRNLHNFTNTLNIVALLLVVISLLTIGVYKFKTIATLKDRKSTEERVTNTIDLDNTAAPRDIYYIILDMYASSSTLKELYDYDNQAFIDYLTAKGFYVASKSRSNYPMTSLSLASSLNMEYVNYLTDMVGIESKDYAVPYQMIKNSKVMNFLKSKGYKFIHFSSSGFGPTDHNRYADLDVHCSTLNEFQMMLIQTTVMDAFFSLKNIRKRAVLCTFSKLAEVYKIEGPIFVFAHIDSPHKPFLFGANGEPVTIVKLKEKGRKFVTYNPDLYKKNYLNQLIFISKKVEMLIDEILSRSEVPPIIILQADHGPQLTFTDGWEHPTKNMLRERTTIFNAYYLPPDGNKLLYDSITPVNTFRVVFDFYFHTNYGLLGDQSYYSTYARPYEFINVTDIEKY